MKETKPFIYVNHLKYNVYTSGIQVDQIRLIHGGRQLSDDKSLQDENITAGTTIHMVLQLRG